MMTNSHVPDEHSDLSQGEFLKRAGRLYTKLSYRNIGVMNTEYCGLKILKLLEITCILLVDFYLVKFDDIKKKS